MSGWIAVDLDGTLAHWGEPYDVLVIGEPILPMVDRVKAWLADDLDVRIFTARVGPATADECLAALIALSKLHAQGAGLTPFSTNHHLPQEYWDQYQRALIGRWCHAHLGVTLPITATKDFHMWQHWDDRCVQVVPNTGLTLIEHALATPR